MTEDDWDCLTCAFDGVEEGWNMAKEYAVIALVILGAAGGVLALILWNV